ncbi:MAG TPA: DNA topoisomerase (ATP-hydrolyzing), partial [Anaerolineales bacterium]
MEVGLIRQIDIDQEMQQSYLDYAMSVIIARALPDARDGLKPVHRRILHAVHSMGIGPSSDTKKSARIVGEVLGKYHPHGDVAVYDAMARMVQTFSMRYPLFDGQGNFGSLDGDPPAAMRYTEARLSPIAVEMLAEIEKDTVDMADNFDGSLLEPTVLPSGIPNLLVNGSTGIAVGMATSIPPHNLGEVCSALIYMLEHWTHLDKITLDSLMKHIQGPDFPTGGILLRVKGEEEGLATAYGSGRGKVVLQAQAHIEQMEKGRNRIIVSELPYQLNKSSLIERIAELARAGKLEGLADLRDESDRQGMRIVIELTKTADPEKALAMLYDRTPMRVTFSMITLALVHGEPRLLNLKQALRVYLEHRLTVVQRRSQFDLARARERTHVLEGLRVALQHLDKVVELIRSSKDVDQARERLMRQYKLSEIQANAILEMPLRRLAALERKKIEDEYKETVARIRDLEELLASEKKMRAVVGDELSRIREKYGDRRRTQIVVAEKGAVGDVLTAGEVATEDEMWVVVTDNGLISRSPIGRMPRLSGRSAPRMVLGATGRDVVYLFDARGNAAALAAQAIPECEDPRQGVPISKASPLPPATAVVAGIALPPERSRKSAAQSFLLLATVGGMLKKTPLEGLPGPSSRTFQAMKVAEADRLGWAILTTGEDELLLTSSTAFAIRFPEAEVRATGLGAGGVSGMKLEGEQAYLAGVGAVSPNADLLLVTVEGKAKRTPVTEFPRQGRNGKGVRAWKSSENVLIAAGLVGLAADRGIVHFAAAPAKSFRFAEVPRRPRTGSGLRLVDTKEGDHVVWVNALFERIRLDRANGRPSPRSDGRPAGKKKRSKARAHPKKSGPRSPRGGKKAPGKRRTRRGKSG